MVGQTLSSQLMWVCQDGAAATRLLALFPYVKRRCGFLVKVLALFELLWSSTMQCCEIRGPALPPRQRACKANYM